MPNIIPEHIIIAYVAVEMLKFVVNKGIQQKQQMIILRDISQNMKEISNILKNVCDGLCKCTKKENT